jgi:tRNA-splicing ligase RtcB
MDLGRLKEINPWCYALTLLPGEQRAPVRLYADAELLRGMDAKVLEQIANVARLPGLVGAAMTMPDAHWGYGFPIGGVAAFDAEAGGIISAGGVGFDISCGIRCLRTNLDLAALAPRLERLADVLFRAIPAGVGEEGKIKLSPVELDAVMRGGARWALDHGYGVAADLEYIEEHGCVAGAVPAEVSDLAKRRQRGEMGTLGSGNHYLEIQVVERIYDAAAAAAYGIAEGQVLVAIHCGSRGLGHQVGTDYLVTLAKAAGRLGIRLPERELACAPIKSPEGQQYLGAMNAAINIALANRQILTHLARAAFAEVLPEAQLETLYDVSHNTCKVETHVVNPEAQNSAFASASHGAGRAMSRHQALRQWHGRELIHELAANGILIRTRSMRGAAEEAPGAYKDVDLVAEATEKAGLARRVALLRPKACVKG